MIYITFDHHLFFMVNYTVLKDYPAMRQQMSEIAQKRLKSISNDGGEVNTEVQETKDQNVSITQRESYHYVIIECGNRLLHIFTGQSNLSETINSVLAVHL